MKLTTKNLGCFVPSCTNQCTNSNYSKTYAEDKSALKVYDSF